MSVWYYRTIDKNFLNRLYVPKQVYLAAPKKEFLIIFYPFLEPCHQILKRQLQTSIRNLLPQCNIKVILKSTNHLSSLFRFKDVIPKELRSQLIQRGRGDEIFQKWLKMGGWEIFT